MNPLDPYRDPAAEDLFGWATIVHWIGFVLRSPFRHKLLALGSFLAILSIACAAVAVVPFQFQVQSTLLAGYQQAGALSNPMERGMDLPTRAAREVLLRRENLRQLLNTTDFVEQATALRPWAIRMKDQAFDLIRGTPRLHEDVVEGMIDTLASRLWVDVRPEGTIYITFQWWNAELARQIVEAAQDSFLQARRLVEVDAVGEAVEILEAQQAHLEVEIESAISAYEKKQEQLRGSTVPAAAPPPRPASPGVSPELARLQRELSAKQRTLVELEESRRDRLSQLQADLVQQQSVYAANHPIIAGTRRVLASLATPDAKVGELREEIDGLEREIARRGGRPSLRSSPEPFWEARLRLDSEDPRLDFERGRLESLLRQHTELRNRVQGVRLEKDLAEAAFEHRYSVVSPARIPRGPIKPYPTIFLIGGLLGGVAFAIFTTAVVDFRSGRIIERWQLEHQLGIPVLIELSRDETGRTDR